jgi:hypothetical protein
MTESWTKVGALLPAALASLGGCARLSQVEESAGAGSGPPQVQAIHPQPGVVPADARFMVLFSARMDEGLLLAASGRSETVVLAAEAVVERAAAAIAHSRVTVEERSLFVPAAAEIAPDARSIALSPGQPLAPGIYFLLVSPRLRDAEGRKFASTGARFAFHAVPPAPRAKLISPLAGSEVPKNLAMLHASAEAGRVALVDVDGLEVAGPADARGEVEFKVHVPLKPGWHYRLALDGVPDDQQSFTVSPCARTAPPALQGGEAPLSVRDSSVTAHVALDWPARVELQLGQTEEPCVSGGCVAVETRISCAPSACGPQTFGCTATLRIDGLRPATAYVARITARDDEGFTLRGPPQRFTTMAALPRMILSEVMHAPPPPAPRSDGEYIEIVNLGPGAAAIDKLALAGSDGVPHPLLAAPPPIPVQLAPGQRALAVGASFDPTRYPALPQGTPILRAATQRLLGRGLSDDAPPPLRLLLQGAVPVELASFPGGGPPCAEGVSLQRDEVVPPGSEAPWACGRAGGTPGAAP